MCFMSEDPIIAIHKSHVEASKVGDIRTLTRDLEDNVIFMPPAEATLVGKEGVEQWWREYFEYFTILDFETTERTVDVVGECAVERVGFSLKLVPQKGGAPIYDDGRFLTVWRRQP